MKIGPKAILYSRHGHDLSRRFPTVTTAVAQLPAKSVTLDGELVQAGERGIDFYDLTTADPERHFYGLRHLETRWQGSSKPASR